MSYIPTPPPTEPVMGNDGKLFSLPWYQYLAQVENTTTFSVSGTDNVIVRFDGTSAVQGSAWRIGDGGNMSPIVADGGALGTAALPVSDLLLAAGGIIYWDAGDVMLIHSSNQLALTGASSGYSVDAKLFPASNDGAALGDTTHNFSDLFLASGSVVNWNNSNITLTHQPSGDSNLTLDKSLLLDFGTVTSGFTGLTLLQTDTGTNSSRLTFFKDSSSPQASDSIGQIVFYSRDLSNNVQLYAKIVSQIEKALGGDEAASLTFNIFSHGSSRSVLKLNDTGIDDSGNVVMDDGAYFYYDGSSAIGRIHRLNRLLVGAACLASMDSTMTIKDWCEAQFVNTTKNAQTASTCTTGLLGVVGASRSSDYYTASGGSSTGGAQGVTGVGVNDDTHGGAAGPIAAGLVGFVYHTASCPGVSIGAQIDASSDHTPVEITPYNWASVSGHICTLLLTGGGNTRGDDGHAFGLQNIGALLVLGGGAYSVAQKGIIVDSNSLASGGSGNGIAMELATGLSLRWRSSGGVTQGEIWADTGGFKVLHTTTANAANAVLDSGTNVLARSTSSERYKRDIVPVQPSTLERTLDLKPIEYYSLATNDDPNKIFYGLTAERVAEVDESLVSWTNVDGKSIPDGVMYDRVLLLQVAALSAKVEALEKRVLH